MTFQVYDSMICIFVAEKWETMPFKAEDSLSFKSWHDLAIQELVILPILSDMLSNCSVWQTTNVHGLVVDAQHDFVEETFEAKKTHMGMSQNWVPEELLSN